MIKSIISLTLVFFLFNCSSVKIVDGIPVKIHKTKKYTFDHHKDWYKFKMSNRTYFSTNRLDRNPYTRRTNHFVVIEKKITNEFKTVEDIALNDITLSEGKWDNVTHLLSKKTSGDETIFILELLFESHGVPYKTFGQYKKSGNTVYGLFYNFKLNIYNEYLSQAHIMFDSFKFID
jgi:hypothetical protein